MPLEEAVSFARCAAQYCLAQSGLGMPSAEPTPTTEAGRQRKGRFGNLKEPSGHSPVHGVECGTRHYASFAIKTVRSCVSTAELRHLAELSKGAKESRRLLLPAAGLMPRIPILRLLFRAVDDDELIGEHAIRIALLAVRPLHTDLRAFGGPEADMDPAGVS